MRRRLWLGLSLALAMVLSLVFTDVAHTDATSQSFSAVVEANFSKWDRNRDGKLDAKEVGDLITEHSITGDAAAALAAIHAYLTRL